MPEQAPGQYEQPVAVAIVHDGDDAAPGLNLPKAVGPLRQTDHRWGSSLCSQNGTFGGPFCEQRGRMRDPAPTVFIHVKGLVRAHVAYLHCPRVIGYSSSITVSWLHAAIAAGIAISRHSFVLRHEW